MPSWIIMSFIPGDKDRVGKRSYKKWSAESRDTFAKEFADVLKGIRGYPSSLFYFIIYFYVVSIRDFKHSFLHSFNADLSLFAEIGRYMEIVLLRNKVILKTTLNIAWRDFIYTIQIFEARFPQKLFYRKHNVMSWIQVLKEF